MCAIFARQQNTVVDRVAHMSFGDNTRTHMGQKPRRDVRDTTSLTISCVPYSFDSGGYGSHDLFGDDTAVWFYLKAI